MGCTVEELGRRMTAEEFERWMAFGAEEPFGIAWDRLAYAGLAARLANGLTPRRDGRAWRLRDVLPEAWVTRREAPTDAASLRAFLRGLKK